MCDTYIQYQLSSIVYRVVYGVSRCIDIVMCIYSGVYTTEDEIVRNLFSVRRGETANMLRRLRLRRLGLRGVTVSAVLVRSAPCVREVEIMVIETDVHVVIRL